MPYICCRNYNIKRTIYIFKTRKIVKISPVRAISGGRDEFEGHENEFVISGIFQSITDLGRTCNMSFEGAKKIIPNLKYNFTSYKIEDPDKSAEITEFLKQNYGDKIEVIDCNIDSFDDVLISALQILEVAIYIISIVFAYVVVIIVCGKVFLKESMDYGIYKAIGYSTNSLRTQFAFLSFLI